MHETIARLATWCENGDIRPHICARFPLEEVASGLDLPLDRRSTGKVLLETLG